MALTASVGLAQAPPTSSPVRPLVGLAHDSITVHMVDTDVRLAVEALAPYLDKPVVFGSIAPVHVSLETPRPVPRAGVQRLLEGVLQSQNLELVLDSAAALYRVEVKPPPKPISGSVLVSHGAAANGGADDPELFTIQLQHARAVDVAATVNALYGRGGAVGESAFDRGVGQTLSQGLQQNLVPPQAPAMGPAVAASPPGKAAVLSGETVIIPDKTTNMLLIRANQHDFALIQAVVKQLDVRPLQVLIEVIIAEVTRNSQFALGIGSSVSPTEIRRRNIHDVTVGGVMGNGPVSDSTLGDFVLHVLKRGSGIDVNATLVAAQQRGEARILSRPVLIAANGETAEILVGSQRPFIQVQRSLPTDVPSRDEVVEYKDVGTKLSVKPTISADGYVMLSVSQEVNQATTEVQFGAPVISTRTVQTELLVHDSQTVVLGGLSDQQRDNSRSGIPILSQIPLLGGLFGASQRQTNETEFFLFITPRVIRSDADAEHLSAPLRKRSGGDRPQN